MNKSRKTSNLYNIVTYDDNGHVVFPGSLTLGAAPASDDNSLKVGTTSWIRTYINSLSLATSSTVSTEIANLIDAAPSTLNTLNELAAALGDDANFSTTVTTSIASRVPQTRTITINGTAFDLSSDRSWTIAAGLTSFNTRTGAITLTSADVTTALGYTPYNSTNPSNYITGITSSMVTTALGFTPYNATNPSGYITSSDNITGYSNTLVSNDIRTLAPNSSSGYRAMFGFTSWANNNTSPWADYILLRSYGDTSGGSDNLITFLKSGIGMRIWQQSFGSSSSFSTYVDVLHSTNFSSYALPLSGGTLTGALSGTSATFSGALGAGATTITSGGGQLTLVRSSFNTFQFGTGIASGINGLVISDSTAGTNPLIIAQSTGAATFSSSVRAVRLDAYGSGTNDLLFLDAGVNTDFAYKIVSGADDAFVLRRQHTTQGGLDIMSWTYSGNVGIGTNTPSSRLSLGTGVGAKFLVFDNGSSVYSGIGQDLAAGNSTDFFAHGLSNLGFLTFGKLGTNKTTYTEWMRINPSGNVGIGTTNPDSGLNINSGATRGLRIDTNSGIQGFSMSPNSIFGIDEPGLGNTRFIINTNGRVGIGTSTPGGRLDVNGDVRGHMFPLMTGGTFRGGVYAYKDITGSGTDHGVTIFAEGGTNNGNIYFCPNGSATRAVIINTSGNVGIGTSSPTSRLDVGGTVTATNYVGTNYVGNWNGRSIGEVEGDFGQTLNLSGLDPNTYYPVTIDLPTNRVAKLSIRVALNSNQPSWATHPSGFSVKLVWYVVGSGWGTVDVIRFIESNNGRFFSGMSPIGGIRQMTNSTQEVVWLRGGGIYYAFDNMGLSWNIRTSTYSIFGDSVSPTTSTFNNPWYQTTGAVSYGTVFSNSDLESLQGGVKTNGGNGYHVSFRPTGNVTFNVGFSSGNIGTNGPFVNATINGTADTTVVPLYFNCSAFSVFVGYSERMRLNSAGTLYIGDGIVQYFGSWSDIKLKQNLKVISNSLDKISKLTGYTFQWTKNSPYRDTPAIGERIDDAGLIAQDVEEVLPEVVTETNYKHVNYNGVIALHTEGIKELIKQNQALLARITELENKLL